MTKPACAIPCHDMTKSCLASLVQRGKWLFGGLVILIATGVINLAAGRAQMSSPQAVMKVASKGVGGIPEEARATATSLFGDRCAVCHGANGDGKGPGAANLDPKPVDFRDRKWQRSVSDETIGKAIVYGGPAVGLSSSMAANPDLEAQPAVVAALVERIRSLAGTRGK